ncbi:hypothetical protein T439DRAFT_322592 [Meredithblackwellia eburnea MCA 4105]
MIVCTSCQAVDSFEYDEDASAQVCNQCGYVDTTSISQSLVVLGRAEEDGAERGRNYLHDGGNPQSNRESKMAGDNKAIYHTQKLATVEVFMRTVLSYFGLSGHIDRVKLLFHQARAKLNFRWGQRARVVASACVYIMSLERGKLIRLTDLASILQLELSVITRAHRKVTELLQLTTVEREPAAFLETILLHFSTLLTLQDPLFHSGKSKTSRWPEKQLIWLRALNLMEVRKVAEGLLAFVDEQDLYAGRNPDIVAGAAVLLAMEAVARTISPCGKELRSEFAFVVGHASETIFERYRELMRLLIDYAPNLPWLAPRAKAMRKNDIVANISDIVKFRANLEKSKRLKREASMENSLALDWGRETEDGQSDAGSDEFSDPLERQSLAPKAGPSSSQAVPLASNRRAEKAAKRPAEYMRNTTSATKRIRTLDRAASSLATSSSASFLTPSISSSPFLPASPMIKAESDTSSIYGDPQLVRSGSCPLLTPFTRVPVVAAPSHDPETLRLRRHLLAGTEVSEVYRAKDDSKLQTLAGPSNRLDRLLWVKREEEITDEELFGEGELEGFVRTPAEVQFLLRTDRFKLMPDSKPYDEEGAKKRLEQKERKKAREGSSSAKTVGKSRAESVDATDSTTTRESSPGSDAERRFYSGPGTKATASSQATLALLLGDTEDDDDVYGFRHLVSATKRHRVFHNAEDPELDKMDFDPFAFSKDGEEEGEEEEY